MRALLPAVVAALAVTSSGCFFEAFDPAGHACTTQADCLEGYRCEANVCVAGEPGDAGMDADLDALTAPDAPDATSAPDATLDAAMLDAPVLDVGMDAPADDAGRDAASDDASASGDADLDASPTDDAAEDASAPDDAGDDASASDASADAPG